MTVSVREPATTPVPRPPGAPLRPRHSPLGWLVPRPIRRRIDRFDDSVDAAVDIMRGNPHTDRLFYVASELGDFSLIWLVLGTAQGLRSEQAMRRALRLAAALGVESALVNVLVKTVVRRRRPVAEFARPLPLRVPRTTSFPSGHASAAFTAAALLSDGEPPAVRRFYYLLAGVVATSRVYVKIHHASDVVGGAAIGAALGALARRGFPLSRR